MKKTTGASQYHPRVHFVRESSNRKTGPIPVSTTASDSCPDACPLKAGGCYAKGGPLAIHWKRLDKTARSTARESWTNFLANVAGLPDGQLWRHNQAGDLCGENNKISARFIRQLIKANKGKRGFTYTHKPVDNANATNRLNAKLVAESNANGFTVNLSADTVTEADELAALGIGPVVSILPEEYGRKANKGEFTESLAEYRERTADLPRTTPDGRKVVVCPAQYLDAKSCADCKLCSHANRTAIVGFAAHGQSKRKATEIANGKAAK